MTRDRRPNSRSRKPMSRGRSAPKRGRAVLSAVPISLPSPEATPVPPPEPTMPVTTPVAQAESSAVGPEPIETPLSVVAAPPPQAPGIAVPEAPSSPARHRVEEFLGFCLGSEESGVWIRSVKEIIRPLEITPIPRSPEDILGLISLRGTIVPIFNIRRRFGLPPHSTTSESRVVVCVLDCGPLGLLVDRVTEVFSTDPEALEPPPATLGEREAAFVTATVRYRQRLIGVLHLERLVVVEPPAAVRPAA